MNMLNQSWETKIKRADELAAAGDAAKELLVFYGQLLRAQKKIYDALRNRKDGLPAGRLQEDLPILRALLPDLLKTIEHIGPPLLTQEARALMQLNDTELNQLLLNEWQAPASNHFFAKAFLQPYARRLAELNLRPLNRNLESGENRCPVCAGKPQVSCLVIQESSADGGGRDLICSTCLSVWPFRRVVCASCGEERPAKLGWFQSSQYDFVRIEACDSCGYYLKGVDLTRFGFAVPLVDEVAAAPLDLWAREQGYQKIELNLVGL
jgi:formate dehydrogenase accessory protein FdhE